MSVSSDAAFKESFEKAKLRLRTVQGKRGNQSKGDAKSHANPASHVNAKTVRARLPGNANPRLSSKAAPASGSAIVAKDLQLERLERSKAKSKVERDPLPHRGSRSPPLQAQSHRGSLKGLLKRVEGSFPQVNALDCDEEEFTPPVPSSWHSIHPPDRVVVPSQNDSKPCDQVQSSLSTTGSNQTSKRPSSPDREPPKTTSSKNLQNDSATPPLAQEVTEVGGLTNPKQSDAHPMIAKNDSSARSSRASPREVESSQNMDVPLASDEATTLGRSKRALRNEGLLQENHSQGKQATTGPRATTDRDPLAAPLAQEAKEPSGTTDPKRSDAHPCIERNASTTMPTRGIKSSSKMDVPPPSEESIPLAVPRY